MKWEAISRIYDAIIVKVLVLFSVISILTILTPIKLIIEGFSTSISLLGAITISISYGMYKVFIPSLILFYKTSHEYTKSVIEQHMNNQLDNYVEFEIVERSDNIKLIRKLTANDPSFRTNKVKIADVIDTVEPSRALKSLSIVKFEIINQEKPWCRWIVTILFAVGVAMMYWPSLERIIETIIGGLD